MLLRFGVQNHKSIRDYQEISLVASRLKDREEGLFSIDRGKVSSPKSRVSVVPVLAIYGANASGKSTMLNAFEHFISAIRWSHSRGAPDSHMPFRPFLLDDESKNLPSRYDADFVVGDARYHYGFTISLNRVESEWLYSFPTSGARQTRTVLFHRDHTQKSEFQFGKQLRGENKQIAKLARKNSLFLSAAAQNAHPQLLEIYDYFANNVTSRLDGSNNEAMAEQLIAYFGEDEARRGAALRFLQSADIGISGIDFSNVPIEQKSQEFALALEQLLMRHMEGGESLDLGLSKKKEKAKVELSHKGAGSKCYPIKISDESAGTLSLLRLLGPVFSRLNDGGVLVVDELNSTLHPLVSRELIRLFSEVETNPGHAQLLFTTHDTNILSGRFLRRDQIWFAEKDPEGATHFYSLSAIKVRASENLEHGYLAGRYGAIPFFADGARAWIEKSDLASED